MKYDKGKRTALIFTATLIIIVAVFASSIIKTDRYNKTSHEVTFEGSSLFPGEEDTGKTEANDVSVVAVPRGSTWTKVFDFENKGLTEHNYRAYTYDFNVNNNTRDGILRKVSELKK